MGRRPASDLIHGATDLLVLSVLAEGRAYGYAITKQLAARSEGTVRLTPGVLYPLLHQMEKQGLVKAEWDAVKSETGNSKRGRQRKWYKLSAKGRRRLKQRVAAHRAYQQLIESFLPAAD